jgi:2'-5' RNA ligase
MRLFTGIAIPGAVIGNLEALLDRLRPAARINWSPPANLHITTKFIGEWPQDRLDEVIGKLRSILPGGDLQIAIQGLGWFPNPHNPRILWAAVKAPQRLKDLVQATEDALATLGIEREKKQYSPHLTLARIKEPVPLAPLRQAIAGLDSTDLGEFTASRFCLYQSRTNPSGSIYTELAEFPLERE